MLGGDEPEYVMWLGWKATLASLQEAGWDMTRKHAYRNWRSPVHSSASHEYIYLRHPQTRMIARITRQRTQEPCPGWHLYYLTHERNRRLKPHPVYDEVEPLLEMLLDLQQQRPRRRNRDTRQFEEWPQKKRVAI